MNAYVSSDLEAMWFNAKSTILSLFVVNASMFAPASMSFLAVEKSPITTK